MSDTSTSQGKAGLGGLTEVVQKVGKNAQRTSSDERELSKREERGGSDSLCQKEKDRTPNYYGGRNIYIMKRKRKGICKKRRSN